MTRRRWMVYLAPVLVCAAALAQSESATTAPADPNVPVDAEYGQAYNQFRDEIDKHLPDLVRELTRRYELSDQQAQQVTQKLQDRVNDFMKDNGQQVFDLVQKGRALGEYMRQNNMRFQDVDADVVQDLARQVLPLFEAYTKQAQTFADDVATDLDGRQKALLARDRQQVEITMRVVRSQVRQFAGVADKSDEATVAAIGFGGRRGATSGPADEAARWKLYVDTFCHDYALDAVQQQRANTILAGYLVKLEAARKAAATSQPATAPANREAAVAATQPAIAAGQPTTRPASGLRPADFRTRLEQSKPPVAKELFDQMVKELNAIPTEPHAAFAQQHAATRPSR